MRDRLVELIEKANDTVLGFFIDGDISILADYLLANGVIVPPVKVGDIVYEVDDIRIYAHKVKKVIYDTESIAFDETAIGKSIFVNGVEAEKTLAKRRGI